MSMAVAADPNGGGQSTAFGQYFTIVLTLIFLALGAHLQWIALLSESYRSFPPGRDLARCRALRANRLLRRDDVRNRGCALRLPVTLVLLLVQVLTGVLSRSAPSLNLFALGLPAGVLAGIAALIIAAPLLFDQFSDLVALSLGQAESVIAAMSERRRKDLCANREAQARCGPQRRCPALQGAGYGCGHPVRRRMVRLCRALAAGRAQRSLARGAAFSIAATCSIFSPGGCFCAGLLTALPPILTIAAPMIALALITQLAFGDGRWVGENLAFKGSRINPLSGLKRMFGPTGWIEMGKGLLKVALLGAIAFVWGRSWLDTIAGLGSGNLVAAADRWRGTR